MSKKVSNNVNKGKFFIKNGDDYEELKEIADFAIKQDPTIEEQTERFFSGFKPITFTLTEESADILRYEFMRMEQEERGERAEA